MASDILSLEDLKNQQEAAHFWLRRSIHALLSLWNHPVEGAFRNTDQVSNRVYFPTATFHAVSALGECGLWHGDVHQLENTVTLRTPYFDLALVAVPPIAADVAKSIILGTRVAGPTRQELPNGGWLHEQLNRSSHLRDGKHSSRSTVVLERLLSALSAVLFSVDQEFHEAIVAGVQRAWLLLRDLFLGQRGSFVDPAEFYESAQFAPAILLNIATCLYQIEKILLTLAPLRVGEVINLSDISMMKNIVKDTLVRHIDHHMARHRVDLDPSYDPVSLAFALRGLSVLSPEIRAQPFFKACIRAVIDGQHTDGCWPDGVSITYEPTADVVQQPSVGVALLLAECIIDSKSLVDHYPEQTELLDLVLIAMRRMSQYLKSTYVELQLEGVKFSGWSSDRVRRPNYCETWITAMAARFFFRLWLGEKSAVRSHALAKLGIPEHRSLGRTLAETQSEWQRSVVDPDGVTTPTIRVWTNFIDPILRIREKGVWLQRPSRDSVSFILFGPPGSGKTFFVRSVAQTLGWPLITLTPGHFIGRGLELIEATARELFENLRSIEHAVVFFDECDELFRSREETGKVGRSILSFATASMLPKLQDLHDSRNVLFVLGTNFIRNIDTAVRRPGRFDEILLFDRPDDIARRKFIKSLLGPDEVNRIEELIGHTRGLTFSEIAKILGFVRKGIDLPVETSLEDYRDWCAGDGPEEIKESRLSEKHQRAVLRRWFEFKKVT